MPSIVISNDLPQNFWRGEGQKAHVHSSLSACAANTWGRCETFSDRKRYPLSSRMSSYVSPSNGVNDFRRERFGERREERKDCAKRAKWSILRCGRGVVDAMSRWWVYSRSSGRRWRRVVGSFDVTGIAIVLKSLPTYVSLSYKGYTFLRKKARSEGGGIVMGAGSVVRRLTIRPVHSPKGYNSFRPLSAPAAGMVRRGLIASALNFSRSSSSSEDSSGAWSDSDSCSTTVMRPSSGPAMDWASNQSSAAMDSMETRLDGTRRAGEEGVRRRVESRDWKDDTIEERF